MTLTWLDLCSGLGGASQPALDRGWRVIRLDIDSRFKPDIVADVRSLPLRPFHVDVLWASPPCQEFSKCSMPWYAGKSLPPPSTALIECVQGAITDLHPAYWVIENVRGARKWLTPLLGRVILNTTGHVLWGNVPCLFPDIRPHKGSLGHYNGSNTYMEDRLTHYYAYQRKGRGHGGVWGTGHNQKDGAAVTAKIPYEIGEAICIAVERRQSVNNLEGIP